MLRYIFELNQKIINSETALEKANKAIRENAKYLEEAENAVDKLNAHTDFEIRTWAEDFRTFMNVAYPYKLCFSVEAGQTIERMVRRLNYRHERILVEDVYANINIDSRNTSIHYRGRTTSSEVSKPKFEGEYKIVKEKKKH